MTPTLPEEAVKAAQDAFNKTINDPIMVPCNRCSGKGYHYGFGEDGASPDWCVECGGSAFDVVPGEEERAMRAALTAALPFLPVQGAVKKLEETLRELITDQSEGEWDEKTIEKDVRKFSARILSALEPSAARELALEQAEAALQKIVNNWGNLHHKDLMQARAAIRALSSPDHADAGKVEGDGWPTGEYEVDYEVICNGEWVAGSTDLNDAEHYAAVYSHDGEIEIVEARTYRRPLPSALASEGTE